MTTVLKLLGTAEIHKEPKLESRCLKVVEHLSRMCRQQRRQGLGFYNDLFKTDEVCKITFIQGLPLIENLKGNLATERYARPFQFTGQCLLLNRLKETMPQDVVYFHTTSNKRI